MSVGDESGLSVVLGLGSNLVSVALFSVALRSTFPCEAPCHAFQPISAPHILYDEE